MLAQRRYSHFFTSRLVKVRASVVAHKTRVQFALERNLHDVFSELRQDVYWADDQIIIFRQKVKLSDLRFCFRVVFALVLQIIDRIVLL